MHWHAPARIYRLLTLAGLGEFFVSHTALLPGDDADFEKDEIVEYIALTLFECDADAVRDTLAGGVSRLLIGRLNASPPAAGPHNRSVQECTLCV